MLPYRNHRLSTYALIVFFLLLAAYAYYEFNSILFGPRITVPANTVVHERFTTVRGQAENISELRLNGAVVAVTEEGVFEEPYVLARGENTVILEARDNYGRSRRETVTIIYIPDE